MFHKILNYVNLILVVYVLTVITGFIDYDIWARFAVGSHFIETGHLFSHDTTSNNNQETTEAVQS